MNDEEITVTRGNRADVEDAYVIFDIETTGLSILMTLLIEIGAVKIKGETIIGEFSCY